jgi:hypothetical protein
MSSKVGAYFIYARKPRPTKPRIIIAYVEGLRTAAKMLVIGGRWQKGGGYKRF